MSFERIVLVTRQTQLEALVQRFQTRSQAEFYLRQAGQDFREIAADHDVFQTVLQQVRAAFPAEIKLQCLERRDLPRYRFFDKDLVVALGPDGLVANVAKYIGPQPLLAINPDPRRIDGILLPVSLQQFRTTLLRALDGEPQVVRVTMCEAELTDGQRLRAVNDLFIGARTHGSARYRLEHRGVAEEHSSSGLIVSTGVGSTGWLRSVYAGAIGIARSLDPHLDIAPPRPLPWDARELVFSVREPWPSINTGASLVGGRIAEADCLELMSRMPAGGVIFADGMESDYLEFNSGALARIGIAREPLQLVLPEA